MRDEDGRMRCYVEGYLANALAAEGGHGDGAMLSYESWARNYTTFVVNLNPDQSPPGVLAPPISDVGSMELHMRLSSDPTKQSDFENTALVIGFSGAIVEIDANRAVNRIGF
jgi:hypothetical protein